MDVVLDSVLEKIKLTIPVDIEDYDDDEEWFELSSSDLEDADVYFTLRMNWDVIVGLDGDSFALIHCADGTDSGVWLHYFDDDDEYAPGCHKVPAW